MTDETATGKRFAGVRDIALVFTFLGMVGTSVGWVLQYQQTQEAEKRAYALSQLEDFKTSATVLDDVTTRLFDAIADHQDTANLREEFQRAYRSHVILAESDREVLGVDGTERYLSALGVLRDQVEHSSSQENSVARVEALGDVIYHRRELSESALGI